MSVNIVNQSTIRLPHCADGTCNVPAKFQRVWDRGAGVSFFLDPGKNLVI